MCSVLKESLFQREDELTMAEELSAADAALMAAAKLEARSRTAHISDKAARKARRKKLTKRLFRKAQKQRSSDEPTVPCPSERLVVFPLRNGMHLLPDMFYTLENSPNPLLDPSPLV